MISINRARMEALAIRAIIGPLDKDQYTELDHIFALRNTGELTLEDVLYLDGLCHDLTESRYLDSYGGDTEL